MSKDERDVLELLKAELDYIESGGYGRSVRTPWRPTSVFQDSLTCINFGYPYRAHPCGECFLDALVPPESRTAEVPCHHIPLDAEGTTVEAVESEGNQAMLEEKVKAWLRAKIREIEGERALAVER
ncbi:MAG TPA: hypothetical protein VF240_12005 [Pyrinomonadaceae bacterium]